MRLLQDRDHAVLRALHDRIVDLAPPATVARETDRFLADRLGSRGVTLGLFVGDAMIAYGILGLPQDRAEALIMPDEAAPPLPQQVAVLDGVGVLPEWRGNGLHRHFCLWRQDLARRAGRSQFRATAAPSNPWSWHNLLQAGLQVVALTRMYEGVWRYLLAGPHAAPAANPPTATLVVPGSRLDRQERLLAEGWVGLAPATEGDPAAILLGRWGAPPP